ncbi:L-aspartate oxidase [Anaerobranca gottschalkii]|uniref:L-aspartate oxidase n=1 Tax=Anaerobranca gottschalkii DSM 13577 TaxID=1120990 RepID=A0A1I0AYN5_9FIRM|nr:L-aspartate oxidase [Anaerobranca gottschalkii]SES98912.1 L-aspartate oxidase [Anaerobranca gottschalkii DSM 13577]
MIPRYLADFKKENLKIEKTDVAIIGAGLAGLFVGLQLKSSCNITIITKKKLTDSNTEQAQGGIAAAICEKDSPQLHFKDTINAGHGLCNIDVVNEVVNKGPKAIQALLYYGVPFDRQQGQLALTREGAHSRRRVLHASGDGTGRVIRETLTARIKERNNITLLEDTFIIDIYTVDGEAKGVFIYKDHGITLLLANYVVLASGGAGQLFKYTTNPEVATADGIAMAYRAKADIRDMEFVQFHPTALVLPKAPRFLISEAVRGEGAILVNHHGEAFMAKYHESKDLAPRDVVSRAMLEEMEKSNTEYLFLDVSHMTEENMERRFPTIYKTCREFGINVPKEMIPVAPAAHYFMGGVVVDKEGKTNIKGLLACGEVTSTGLHGANRLASNSLLEALVYGQNIADYINKNIEKELDNNIKINLPKFKYIFTGVIQPRSIRGEIQELMWKYAGLKRDQNGLTKLTNRLEQLTKELSMPKDVEDFETINMLQVSLLLAQGALIRTESRGGHFREDYPKADKRWKKHINFNIDKKIFYSEI